jgi:signal recognition particle subunit SRP54
VFNSLSDRLTATFKNLRTRGKLSEADIDATIREIRRALLDADVAVPVVREFCGVVRERALSAEVSGALNPAQQVIKIVHDELVDVLGGATRPLYLSKVPPTVIMLAGLQGAGKTTLAGKLALALKGQGHTPVLVAADLQRPNAVQQLSIVAGNAGVAVYAPHPGNTSGIDDDSLMPTGDPVQVARDGVAYARDKQHDIVNVDTAGRLGVDATLMKQAADIRAAINPDDVLFVIDAMIGQDAVNTAVSFQEGVDFTGVVLSKLDGDARGGAALSVAKVTGRPIMFASTGEKLSDFEVFHPDRMAGRILDMGDVLTLIEQAEKAFDAAEAEKMAAKVAAGDDFTLGDFLVQMEQLKKLGSMKKMLGMMPGMGAMREQIDNFDDREVDRIKAIIQSMTPAERETPRIIDGSRRARIARGSGSTTTAVNQLLDRFGQAQKMMRQMGKGGMGAGPGGMPMMPGGPGMGFGKKASGRMAPPPKGKKGKSGNPAKRAAQEKAAMQRALGGGPVGAGGGDAAGSAFGLGGSGGGKTPSAPSAADLANLNLPEGLDKLLG